MASSPIADQSSPGTFTLMIFGVCELLSHPGHLPWWKCSELTLWPYRRHRSRNASRPRIRSSRSSALLTPRRTGCPARPASRRWRSATSESHAVATFRRYRKFTTMKIPLLQATATAIHPYTHIESPIAGDGSQWPRVHAAAGAERRRARLGGAEVVRSAAPYTPLEALPLRYRRRVQWWLANAIQAQRGPCSSSLPPVPCSSVGHSPRPIGRAYQAHIRLRRRWPSRLGRISTRRPGRQL